MKQTKILCDICHFDLRNCLSFEVRSNWTLMPEMGCSGFGYDELCLDCYSSLVNDLYACYLKTKKKREENEDKHVKRNMDYYAESLEDNNLVPRIFGLKDED